MTSSLFKKRAREIFADELIRFGEHGLARMVLNETDNSNGGLAAIKAIIRGYEEGRCIKNDND